MIAIALDGPAGAGKSTLGKRLARKLGFHHLDTGLLYRATAARLLAGAGDLGEPLAAVAAAALTADDLARDDLRDEAIGAAASTIAAYPEVRAALLAYQRRFAAEPPGAVLDGRDVGTVVLPDATAKIFVTATVEARAGRRFNELRAKGAARIRSEILRDMQDRDARDRERSVAPMIPASDAFLLDTTCLDEGAAFEAAFAFVAKRLPAGLVGLRNGNA